MADSRLLPSIPARASSPLYRSAQRRPLTWIKRRARRLQRAFLISRPEAVEAACSDWVHFQPGIMQ